MAFTICFNTKLASGYKAEPTNFYYTIYVTDKIGTKLATYTGRINSSWVISGHSGDIEEAYYVQVIIYYKKIPFSIFTSSASYPITTFSKISTLLNQKIPEIVLNVPLVQEMTQKSQETVTITKQVSKVKTTIRIEITDEITDYTIQALKGLDYWTSDPVVIVPTYKTVVYEISEKETGGENEILKNEKLSFNVTRDAWYNLGKDDKGKHIIMNREFVPDTYQRNLYGTIWIPRYPSGKAHTAQAEAFILTRFGDKHLPAKPLLRETHLDDTPIADKRANPNIAYEVMLHIGGTYEVYFRQSLPFSRGKLTGYQHVGGSYGCFGFIPEHQMRVSVQAAKKAVSLDEYDNESSNKEWNKVCNEIKSLAFPKKYPIQILIHEKKTKQYIPIEILEE